MPAVEVLDEHYFAITALVTVAFQVIGFVIAFACQFDKITDFSGATNFVLLAVLTLVLGGEYHPRQIIVTASLLLSRFWLGGFLLYRVTCLRGKDGRFDEMRSRCCAFFGFWVFQMLWVWLVSLPVVFVNSRPVQPPLEALDWVGVAVYGLGLIFEVGGDAQKLVFKQSPDSRGRHPSGGLYCCMRHPNYTGEMLLWWGTFIMAAPTFGADPVGWVSILSPVFTMLILLFLSGMPSAEGAAQTKYMKTPALADEYASYRDRTSPIVPVPPACYGALPRVVKQVFCCEFPMYELPADAVTDDSDAETSAAMRGHGGTPAHHSEGAAYQSEA
ncbi:hypothetical protein FNF29_00366 [Cafeteria roenbergensis]|uniref:Uncharacterized protein n=1 Tax=Cafeteria roenbergensis TaxID=33653 RepID=A0A5A8CWW2_CAFRO|nr:hypothetical protein FNF29_00366 [Cafeteria roenbergensis]|eukprot:KAA0157014.1 hypothetical protein FNF29_00366 [Cafeteria roenbergensis]